MYRKGWWEIGWECGLARVTLKQYEATNKRIAEQLSELTGHEIPHTTLTYEEKLSFNEGYEKGKLHVQET